jgi:DNA-binding response OmpR family regulator
MLLTAHGLALDQVELAQAGVAVCLSKPFSPRELLATVHELLDIREKNLAAQVA